MRFWGDTSTDHIIYEIMLWSYSNHPWRSSVKIYFAYKHVLWRVTIIFKLWYCFLSFGCDKYSLAIWSKEFWQYILVKHVFINSVNSMLCTKREVIKGSWKETFLEKSKWFFKVSGCLHRGLPGRIVYLKRRESVNYGKPVFVHSKYQISSSKF